MRINSMPGEICSKKSQSNTWWWCTMVKRKALSTSLWLKKKKIVRVNNGNGNYVFNNNAGTFSGFIHFAPYPPLLLAIIQTTKSTTKRMLRSLFSTKERRVQKHMNHAIPFLLRNCKDRFKVHLQFLVYWYITWYISFFVVIIIPTMSETSSRA